MTEAVLLPRDAL